MCSFPVTRRRRSLCWGPAIAVSLGCCVSVSSCVDTSAAGENQ